MTEAHSTEERRLLLLDAADDCIECANYLTEAAPNMGRSKELRYRALADESVARAAALRKWAEELGRAPDVPARSAMEPCNCSAHPEPHYHQPNDIKAI